MKKTYRILGKKGRITIPYHIRQSVGFETDDVLSFAESKDGKSVVVRREKICDGCQSQTSCARTPKKQAAKRKAEPNKNTGTAKSNPSFSEFDERLCLDKRFWMC